MKKELINTIGKYYKVKTEEGEKEYSKISKLTWFYRFDIFLISWICMELIFILFKQIIFFKMFQERRFEFGEIKKFFLNQFKGLNIIEKKLPDKFNHLSEKEKNWYIFKKENLDKYEYKMNKNQINLIHKINDIRKENHIPLLKYYEIEKLPEFIVNEKTQIIFNDNENLFKLSPNFYVFKYRVNEIQNFLNNNQIMNIITFEALKNINIIERNNLEFISIYYSINRSKNYNNIPRIHLNIETNINIINAEDKLNEKSESLTVTEISDNEGNEIKRIKNTRINKNHFDNIK